MEKALSQVWCLVLRGEERRGQVSEVCVCGGGVETVDILNEGGG